MTVGLCGTNNGPLWDSNLTWYTENPKLSECFKDTVPFWMPCALFWLLFPFEIGQLKSLSIKKCAWIMRDYFRLGFVTLLALSILIRLVVKTTWWANERFSWFTSGMISYLIIFLTLLAIAFTTFMRQKIVYTGSFVSWLTLLCLILCGSLEFASQIQYFQIMSSADSVSKKFDYYSFMIYYELLIVSFIYLSFSSVKNDSHPIQQRDNKSAPWPEELCSIPNQLFCWWFGSLIRRGYNKTLEMKDIWFVNIDGQCAHICEYFFKQVDAEFASAVRDKRCSLSILLRRIQHEDSTQPLIATNFKQKSPSLLKIIVKCFGLKVFGASMMIIGFVLLTFAEPVFVGLITNFAQNYSTEFLWHGYTYVALMTLCLVTYVFLHQQSHFSLIYTGTKIRSGLMSIVYRKALRLSAEARKSSTTGEIVNLISADASKIKDFVVDLHDMITAPLLLILGYVYLFKQVGVAALSGLAVAFLLLITNALWANVYEKWETTTMELKDERLKIMSEIINGMKVIKLYAWEPAFERRVENIRNNELLYQKRASYLGGFFEVAYHCTVLLSSLATFGTFVLINPDQTLTPEIIFVCLTIFNILNSAIIILPRTLIRVIMIRISLNRLSEFLSCQEFEANVEIPTNNSKNAVEIEAASFSWETSIQSSATLNNINLEIPRGSLVAIVGKIGCGKSCLLNSLCGEMTTLSGIIRMKGTIAYVSQQPWIQNLSIRDNILFNKNYEETAYNKVLDCCALRPDLDILPAGDGTEIGERGINLSGGQKMRVSLARATYQDSDLYLLDDPLAAVDVHVGKQIFDQVIGPQGLLAGKTRLFVTHGLHYLKYCDFVVSMKDGQIDKVGTFQELLNEEGAFSEFLTQYFQQISQEELQEDLKQINITDLTESTKEVLQQRQSSLEISTPKVTNFKESADIVRNVLRTLSVMSDDSAKDKTIGFKKVSPTENQARLIDDETLEEGQVSLHMYKTYAKSAGFGLLITALFVAGSELFQLLGVFWLQIWSDNQVSINTTHEVISTEAGIRNYALAGLAQVLCSLMLGICFATFQIRAARKMHNELLHSLFRAPMSFFDTTPIGRIINRCGRDIATVDDSIPNLIDLFWHFLFETIRCFAAIIIAVPYFALALIPCSICFYFTEKLFACSSRQLRRLEAISRSPIYSHFQESLQGVSTIKAFRQQNLFVHQSEQLIDVNTSADLCRNLANRWISVYLNLSSSLLACSVGLLIVVMVTRGTSAGIVGLTLSYAMDFTGKLIFGVWVCAMLETEMVAVERIEEYTRIEPEADWENEISKPSDQWPESGQVTFSDYWTRYRSTLPPVIKRLTFIVSPGEKVGIVGRTGAGKSSMTLALFRLIEGVKGSILIDGLDIGLIGLHSLRRKLTIIPQEPILFSGSLRSNIDPFEEYDDKDIWQALELSHLKDFVISLPQQLAHEISEGGINVSVGQKQLVCLCRALLRKSKILALDEATASVDVETDSLIQETIREQFKECTVITIAHRINTIMDSDKILVLDNGELVEYDSPEKLRQNPESLFSKMIEELA